MFAEGDEDVGTFLSTARLSNSGFVEGHLHFETAFSNPNWMALGMEIPKASLLVPRDRECGELDSLLCSSIEGFALLRSEWTRDRDFGALKTDSVYSLCARERALDKEGVGRSACCIVGLGRGGKRFDLISSKLVERVIVLFSAEARADSKAARV